MLIDKLSLLQHKHVNFSLPLTRYIHASYLTLPVKTVVLVERPYRTDIHPYASSAMSYDPLKSNISTPSTAVLATDLKNVLGADWHNTEAWFRDSWMYIKAGVFLINVCCFEEFMGNSLNERVAVESFVRDMVVTSYNMSGTAVELVALGNPAISSANRIRSNIADRRVKLKVYRGVNPAGLRHKFGDLTSPSITVGSKELSKALHRAIARSSVTDKCTESDFETMTTIKQANTRGRIAGGFKDLDEHLEEVAQFFKNGGKYEGPVSDQEVFSSLRKCVSKLGDILIEERVILMLANLKENGNSGKGSYTDANRTYDRKSYKGGSSSEVSGSMRGKPAPTPQKTKWLEDDEPLPGTPSKPPVAVSVSESTGTAVPTPSSSAPQTPQQKPMVRRDPSSGRSVSGQSTFSATRNSSQLKFIDEEDSGEDRVPLEAVGESIDLDLKAEIDTFAPSSPGMMTSDEVTDMGTVGEFLHSSSGSYGIDPSVVQEVNEAASTTRASTDTVRSVLDVIRKIRASGSSTVEQDMGFVDGTANLESPIMRLLLSWAT